MKSQVAFNGGLAFLFDESEHSPLKGHFKIALPI